MNDFLPQLKKLQPITAGKSSKPVTGKEIFFMVKSGENDAYIIPVDKKLKPVEADFHYYTGDTAQLLRSLASIKEDMAFQISWDENDTGEVSLNQNPHLLYQLIRCKNIIDEEGKPVSVHPDTTVLQLNLKKDGATIVPQLFVAAEGEEKEEKLSFLSDCFVLTTASKSASDNSSSDNSESDNSSFDNSASESKPASDKDSKSDVGGNSIIYPVASVGDNYRQLSYFLSPFSESMLEQYLSVFFSFIENVQVSYEDYEVEFSENDAIPTPSLSFEKIDADKTLFLRLMESVKGLPLDFVQQFDLSMVASLSSTRRSR